MQQTAIELEMVRLESSRIESARTESAQAESDNASTSEAHAAGLTPVVLVKGARRHLSIEQARLKLIDARPSG